jgi:IclR family transcriptional regulator, KDG regulon repressor
MASNSTVKSATRVFAVLEYFREVQKPLRLKEIVEHLNYPLSSAVALLKTMTAQGYLNFDRSSHTYLPTPKLADLVAWISTGAFEGGPVLQSMKNLQRSTGELIVLGTPNDIYVEYVQVLRSTQEIQLWTPAGAIRLLVQMGMGWLFLSRMPSAVVKRIYDRTVTLGKVNPEEFSIDALFGRLNNLRTRDILFTKMSDYVRPISYPGGSMIAGLLPAPPGHRALSIGIGGPVERLSENEAANSARLRAEIDRLAGIVAGGV